MNRWEVTSGGLGDKTHELHAFQERRLARAGARMPGHRHWRGHPQLERNGRGDQYGVQRRHRCRRGHLAAEKTCTVGVTGVVGDETGLVHVETGDETGDRGLRTETGEEVSVRGITNIRGVETGVTDVGGVERGEEIGSGV